ncbi:dihydrolipoamide acetyltransferase family protein [Mycolicibacterium litorale]|uniref:Dihydrolipoamide acetyltransferase component of pyruvate dehydrogenase complex n=1 Tax=Mycolicibacterium litorale TaxID=758802 RepID=A0AAD1IK18_9MYCO|nr:dihydrolipoamide acetyltransferase family protein [Mycolicibacterium litorale]MCV7413873.1 2-oxo acid dehydrogenase subunit E2 [Mycolicibacterium litorale]TDY03243.1 pyruvate dehydrogenase E2 component (dihydrolipoamide acetyltransferase) [Mycolicibacterium litorale]BBY15037.1 dihydrolipoamide acetyltransferase component of pyruvate dehydrogenase complex [Mycolicibacterium litorale]
MSVQDFLVPDLGEGLQDATITSWAVEVGDEVELNQTLCTVETNKAEVEIPSPYAGRVVERGGEDGQTLDVGSLLIRIATSESATSESTTSESATSESVTPQRKPVLVGYGADDAMDASRRMAPRRPRAKPPVRKLASELNVDLTGVRASGPDGVITREDVQRAAGTAPAGSPGPAETTAVRGVQAEMARRMALSRREIPDAHASVTVDGSALLSLRDRLRDQLRDTDPPVTPFVLTLRMITLALSRHPVLNATWIETADGPQIHRHRAIHLGFGVAAPRGLLVPVITDAQDKTTRELAGVVERLVEEARAGRVRPAELSGSTFTVSNFGALGLDEGVPVINYPEAAILGMGSLKPRAVVVDGDVVARPTMTLTCAFDHRIADGAAVAAFLGELRELVETPEVALLDL